MQRAGQETRPYVSVINEPRVGAMAALKKRRGLKSPPYVYTRTEYRVSRFTPASKFATSAAGHIPAA